MATTQVRYDLGPSSIMSDHESAIDKKDEPDDDDEGQLERMLLQAERLAAQMRSAGQRNASEAILNDVEEMSQTGTYSAMSVASMDTEDVSHAEVVLSSSSNPMDTISGSLTKGTFFKPPKKRDISAHEDRLVMLAEETEDDLESPSKVSREATTSTSLNAKGGATSKPAGTRPLSSSPQEIRSPRSAEVPTTIDVGRAANGQAEVEAAIKAAQDMAMALEAFGEKSSPSPSVRSRASTSRYDSSSTPGSARKSAEGIHYDENRSSVRQKIQDLEGDDSAPAKVNLDKSHFSVDTDDDDSPSKSPPGRSVIMENGIKWEKVSYAKTQDEDYVPMKDYSSPATPPKALRQAAAPVSQTYAQQRAALRRKRRAQQRMRRVAGAAALLVVILASGWYYMPRARTPSLIVEPKKEPVVSNPVSLPVSHEDETTKETEEEVQVAPALEQTDSAEEKLAEGETKPELQPEKEAIVVQKQQADRTNKEAATKPVEADACDMPFAAFLSPLCSGDQMKASGRLQVEQLLQAMMQ